MKTGLSTSESLGANVLHAPDTLLADPNVLLTHQEWEIDNSSCEDIALFMHVDVIIFVFFCRSCSIMPTESWYSSSQHLKNQGATYKSAIMQPDSKLKELLFLPVLRIYTIIKIGRDMPQFILC